MTSSPLLPDLITPETSPFIMSTIAWGLFHLYVNTTWFNPTPVNPALQDSKLDLSESVTKTKKEEERKLRKYRTAKWRFMNYSITTLFGVAALAGQEWVTDTASYFGGWPGHELTYLHYFLI